MVDWIGDPYQCGILSGVLEGAKAAGVTCLCFVGDSLQTDPAVNARHRTFELINSHTVDGLVVLAGTLTHQVGVTGLAAYCTEHFGGLPLCSVSEPLPGRPSVTANNASGIEQVMRHLISVHDRKRIAFVRGPLSHDEAEKRYQAYLAALHESGIPYDERLLAVGNFMEESGYAAIQQFASTPGIRLEGIEAIVASNDSMAVGVMRGLEERGVAVPGSMAVTGFDDVESASLTSPPLTTVRQPLGKLGRLGARSVLEWAQLGTVPSSEQVNTELVIRRSCGCSEGERSPQSAGPELSCGFESALLIRREHILGALARAARGELGAAGRDWPTKLLNAFVSDLRTGLPSGVPSLIEEITEQQLVRGNGAKTCRDVIDCLRAQLVVTLRSDASLRERAEEIFYASHLAIGQVISRGMMRERSKLVHLVRSMSVTCNALGSAHNLTRLRDDIAARLPLLGLRNYYIVTYRNRDRHQAELFMAQDRVPIDDARCSGTFDASTLLPPALLNALSGRAFAVLPLSLREHFLGHMLLELNLDFSYSYDCIADAIGSGLHRSELTHP